MLICEVTGHSSTEEVHHVDPVWGQKCKLCNDGTLVKVRPDQSHFANLVHHIRSVQLSVYKSHIA